MRWDPTAGEEELADSALHLVLRGRCEVLILRMRIEQLVRQLPDQVFGTSSRQGKIALRLWGIVALAETDEMPILRKHVLRAQRVYSLTSEYLHSRRAGLVPPPTELMIWQEDIASLETAVQHLMAPPN